MSYCGLKDKQGRTTQLIAIHRRQIELQDPDLRLKPLGRAAGPLSAANTTSNRFAVTVRTSGMRTSPGSRPPSRRSAGSAW